MSWPLVNLADVAYFQEGPGIRKWQFREEGIKLINVKNIVNEQLVIKNSDKFLDPLEVEDKYTHFLCDEGDLVMASSGATWGKTAWVAKRDLPLCMNTSMIRFKALDNNILDIRYLRHYLKTAEFSRDMDRIITGSAQPNFGSSHLKQILIPLPHLTEQKRISAILDKADAIRRKRQHAIKLADEFLRAVFLDMFGDPVENTMGWDVKNLKELSTKIHSGNTPTGGREVYVDKGIAFFRSQNVWKNKLELNDIAYLDHATHKKMAKSSLKNRDILMTKTGRINTENSSLGRAAMYLGEDDAANINGHVYLIRLKNPELNELILFILTTREYRDYIRSVCVGGIDKRQLNKDHIEQFPIINPPVELQKKFVGLMQLVESKKEKAQQSFQESQKLFNTLSQKAFSGEL